jgi:hypothetical protein
MGGMGEEITQTEYETAFCEHCADGVLPVLEGGMYIHRVGRPIAISLDRCGVRVGLFNEECPALHPLKGEKE